MYTIFVSTVNAITSQIPEDQFSNISASVQTSTTGFATSGVPVSTSEVSTAAVPSSSSSTLDARLIAAIVVPVTVVLIGIFVVVLFLFVWYVYNHRYISSMIYIPVLYLIIVNTINLLQGIS